MLCNRYLNSSVTFRPQKSLALVCYVIPDKSAAIRASKNISIHDGEKSVANKYVWSSIQVDFTSNLQVAYKSFVFLENP